MKQDSFVARWWPRKMHLPYRGRDDIGGALVGYEYAWWQWRQKLRTKSVENLERWYLQPFFFGRS
jgi:hypothetical protein